MTINLFEGARRVALVIAGFWAIGVIVFYIEQEHRVELTYAIDSPDKPPVRMPETSCGDDDRSEWRLGNTANQTKLHLRFCFKAQRAENGKLVIPYRIDSATGKWWGDTKYSTSVSNYTTWVSEGFRVPKADEDWADDQVWPTRLRKAKSASLWLVGGLIAFWFSTWVIGWIVRGFAGIPSGQDRRPPKNPEP